MMRPWFPAAVLAALLVSSILVSGCTSQTGTSQPPASTPGIPNPSAVVTPPPEIPPPGPAGTGTPQSTPGGTPAGLPGTVSQTATSILIQGDVAGLKAPAGNYLDEIRFTVVKAPSAEPVTFEIPNTQIIFEKSGREFGVNYLILSGDTNGNLILENGETFLVSIPFPAQSPQNEIFAGQDFTMVIMNPPSPQVTVTARAPPVLTGEPMILARAPP